MSSRSKRIILAIAGAQLILVLALLALPQVVLAIPGRYRAALAERSPFLSELTENLIDQVLKEEQDLPAPERAENRQPVIIPTIIVDFETSSAETGDLNLEGTPTGLSSQQAPDTTLTPAPTGALLEQQENESTAPDVPRPTATPTATPLPTATPTPTFVPLPRRVVLADMPRVQQSFNNCGPANLTQVLNWYGNETTQAEAASYLKPNPEDRNVSPWQLSDYVNEFTELRSAVHSGGNLELIKRFLAEGMPVVVEKGYEPGTESSPGWFGHYLTVFGYDEDEQLFYSMDSFLPVDPKTGRADSYDVLESYWQHFNYTFYVVYRPEQEDLVDRILGPDMLNPLTMWENAARKAQEEIDADPENAFAWFNLGTSLTRMGEITGEAEFYENGAAAFDEARVIGLPPRKLWYEFRPYIAYMKVGRYDDMLALAEKVLSTQGGRNVEETYLYQGHALLFKGQVAEASLAYERALELNENFYPAEIALQSIG